MRPVRSGPRRGLATACVVLGCAIAAVALCSNWLRDETLSTHRWVTTSARVLRNHDVQSAVSRYLAERLLESTGASTAPARAAAQTATVRVLQSTDGRRLWISANRAAHRRLVSIINGQAPAAAGLSLDLNPIVTRVISRTGFQIPVPAGEGEVQLLDSSRLRAVRTGAKLLRAVAFGSIVLAALLLACGIACAYSRLRALMGAAIGLVVVGLLVITLRLAAVAVASDTLTSGGIDRSAVHATLMLATGPLTHNAELLAIFGAVVALGAWIFGLAGRGLRQARAAV